MHSKISTVQTLFGVKSWRSRLWLLIAFAALCGGVARAQQSDTWTGVTGDGLWSTTNNWTVGGNAAVGISLTNGDNLIFPFLGANYFYHSTNSYPAGAVYAGQITFGTNSWIIGGNSFTITNGIVDAWGSNTIVAPLVLGAPQTFQNTVVGYGVGNPLGGITNNFQTTIAGTINMGTNTLTTGGNGTIYLNGIITGATNGGGALIVSGGVTRLGPSSGSAGNGFGTNLLSQTPSFIPYATNIVSVTTNIVSAATNLTLTGINYVNGGTNYVYSTNIVTASTNVVPASTNYVDFIYGTNATSWTNYTYLITNGFSTNITWTYVTNRAITTTSNVVWATNSIVQVQDVVTVVGGALLRAGGTAATTVPNGAGVGNLWLDGAWDINQSSPTINGLEDSGAGTGIIENLTNTGTYTLTFGNGNSNGVFSGVIQDSSANTASTGTIAVTKTGFGTQTLTGGNLYSGATTINQGTLVLGISPNNVEGSLGASSTQLTIVSGGVFDFSALNGYGGFSTATGPLTVSAGTPTKPYTNFFGSYYPFYPCTTNYVVTVTTNNYVYSNTLVTWNGSAYSTNAVYTTNFLSYSYSTNTIASIINYDVIGNFWVNGGGAISPVTTVAPGIATWSINGNLTLDTSSRSGANRINYLLNNSTAVGGGTNDLIAVSGTLTIGDEVDFVVSTVTGSLASGKYTLMTSSQYISTSPNDANAAKLVLIAPRGITGTFDTITQPGNILLQASGTVAPGTITWAGTPSASTWDVGLTKNWKNGRVSDYFYSQDNVIFDDTGVATVSLPVVLTPSSMVFNNNLSNYVFTANSETAISGTGGITLNGTGSVTLNNPNTFTGDVTINNGTLIMGSWGAYNCVNLYNGTAPGNLIFGNLGNNEIFEQLSGTANVTMNNTFAGFTLQPGANAQIYGPTRGANNTSWIVVGTNVNRSVGSSLYVNYYGAVKSGTANNGLYITNTLPWINGLVFGGWAHNGTDWYLAQTNIFGAAIASYGYAGYTNITSASSIALIQPTNNISVSGATALALTANAAVNTLKMTGPSAITISTGVTLTNMTGGLLVSSAGTANSTILGGTIMGAAGADLIVLNNATLYPFTIGSVIADNGSPTALTLGGLGGTVILTNNNTYTGSTYINNGTLQVGNGTPLGSISTLSAVRDNGVLSFNRPDATSIGAVSGSGNLTQLGTGVLTLTANNTLSGVVTVSAGTLQLGAGGAVGSVSNAVSLVDNATLAINNSGSVGYPQAISGVGDVVNVGTGSFVIATNEAYTGNTIVSNGTMILAASGSVSNTANIIVKSGAVFDASATGLTLRGVLPYESLVGSGTVKGTVTAPANSSIMPGTNNAIGTLTFANNLVLAGGYYDIDMATNGVGIVNDKIVVNQQLSENGGLVIVQFASYLTNGIDNITNGVYNLFTVGSLSGSVANLAVYAPGLPLGQLAKLTNATPTTVDLLVYSGVSPVLTWQGDGGNNYWNATGSSIWKDVNNATAVYANADIVDFLDGGSDNNPVYMNLASVFPSAVNVNATQNYTIGSGSSDAAANIIGGGASLSKSGTGTLTLQSVNNYLGGTVINAGTIQLNGTGASTADGMVGIGPVTDNGALIANNASSEALNGNISGSGSLVQEGIGTLVLAGNNSAFSGPITISSNALQVGNGFTGTLGTGPVTNNGTLIFDVNNSVTVNAPITGTGSYSNVLGTVTLSGSDTYAGSTAVNGGKVVVGSASAVPATTALIMNDSSNGVACGVLDLNGYDITVSSLYGTNWGQGMASLLEPVIYNNGITTNIITINGGGTNIFYGQILDNKNSGTGKVGLSVINGTYMSLVNPYSTSGGTAAYPSLFSGGVTVSNATLSLGGANGAIATSSGPTAEGTDAIGGNGNQNITFTGTNDVFYMAGFSGSSTPTIANTVGNITVTTNATVWMYGPQRGNLTAASLSGGGNIIYQTEYVRGEVGFGNATNYYGTITFCQIHDSTGGNLGYFSTGGFPNANVVLGITNVSGMNMGGASGGNVFPFGTLSGGDNTFYLGGGTQPASDGAANAIYAIGGLMTPTTTNIVGAQMSDAGTGIRMVGSGTLIFTNNVLGYGGQTCVSNGTLAYMPLGNNTGPFNPLTNNYLLGTNFTIVAPGVLDVTGIGGTLYLGWNTTNFQSLFGNGTLRGNLWVSNSSAANHGNVIAPAWGVSSAGTHPGTLTITGKATISGVGTTFVMNVNVTNTPVCDTLNAVGGLTISSARLTVATNNMVYPGGTSNVFRFFPTAVPTAFGLTTGGITNITVPPIPNAYWVTNLTLDGSMALVVSNTASTNALLTNLVLSAGTLVPAFSSNTLTYAAAEAYVNGTITVTPTDWSTNATNYVVYLGATNVVASGVASPSLTLNANPAVANVVRVHVTAQDNKTVSDYVVNVTRNPDRTPGAIVNSFDGSYLTMSWPLSENGYQLQAQTNQLGTGLSTNWVVVAGSTSTNVIVIPITATNGSVFYRLVNTNTP
jgi:autotransporter-associated beta strand protein